MSKPRHKSSRKARFLAHAATAAGSSPVAVANGYSAGPSAPAFAQQSTARNYVERMARNEKLHLTGPTLRAVHYKAAKLFKDVPFLRGPAIRVADYIGPVTPRPATLDTDWNTVANAFFQEFIEAKLWDASRKYSFTRWQGQLDVYADVYGDALSVFTEDAEGIPCTRIIPALDIDNPPGQWNDRTWRDGVKTGLHNAHEAWHVVGDDSGPLMLSDAGRRGFVVEAANGELLARWDGVNNTRGTSMFIGSGNTIIDMQMMDAGTHEVFNLIQKVGMSLETEFGAPQGNVPRPVQGRMGFDTVASNQAAATGETVPDVKLYREEFLGGGPAVMQPGPGQKLKFHTLERDLPDPSAIRGSDYERIAMSYGLPVQTLFGIHSGAFNLTGPGFRMCLAQSESWRTQRLKDKEPLVRRQYVRIIEWAIRTKQLPLPKKDYRWWAVEMQHEKSYTIDESRDIKSLETLLRLGATTEQEIARMYGRDALQCVRERLVFIEAAYNGLTEKKLPTSVYFPQEKVVPPPAGAEPEPAAAPAPDNKPAAPAKK